MPSFRASFRLEPGEQGRSGLSNRLEGGGEAFRNAASTASCPSNSRLLVVQSTPAARAVEVDSEPGAPRFPSRNRSHDQGQSEEALKAGPEAALKFLDL